MAIGVASQQQVQPMTIPLYRIDSGTGMSFGHYERQLWPTTVTLLRETDAVRPNKIAVSLAYWYCSSSIKADVDVVSLGVSQGQLRIQRPLPLGKVTPGGVMQVGNFCMLESGKQA